MSEAARRRRATLGAVEYYLPAQRLTNEDLAEAFPDWPPEKILAKTGIAERRVAAADEFVSDMAVLAAEKLFASGAVSAADVDFVLLCTQSPDYFLPTTACLVQTRLGIPTTCGALDFNLGCSGYIYGLGLAKGLIESGQARNVLLLTSETYSRHLHPGDKSVRTLFGDAAAASIVVATEGDRDNIGPVLYGTDGRGAQNLIVKTGGMREARDPAAEVVRDSSGNSRTINHLYMNGAEIFNFTLRIVPDIVRRTLDTARLDLGDIDLFVFHQANSYMLEHLRKKLGVPQDKFVVSMTNCGNTVSSTIPIALREAVQSGQLTSGMRVMLVGFGVGYSWGATIVQWAPQA